MQEQYRLLVDEQLICGLQIHVGVPDRDLAVEIMQRIARDLPVLLALSASSPFWNEQDSGYASMRSMVWQRWPTAGATGRLGSAAEYDEMIADLIRTGVIADSKMAYFDVRPSSPRAHPRAAHLRRLPAGRRRHPDRRAVPRHGPRRPAEHRGGRPFDPVPPPVHRAALWRAARSGLAGVLLDDSRHPEPLPAAEAVDRLVNRLRPQLSELGDWDEVAELRRDARPGQLGRPAAGGVRGAGPAQRCGRPGGRGDPRSRRWTGARHPGPAALPLPGRRRGCRSRPPAPAGLRRPGQLLPRAVDRRPGGAQERRATVGWTRAGLDFGVERRDAALLGRPDAAGDQRRTSGRACPPGSSSGPGPSSCSWATSTAPAGPGRRRCSAGSWSSSPPAGGRGHRGCRRRRPGPGDGVRPGPQRVRRLAGAGGQRAQPQRRGVRDRRSGS